MKKVLLAIVAIAILAVQSFGQDSKLVSEYSKSIGIQGYSILKNSSNYFQGAILTNNDKINVTVLKEDKKITFTINNQTAIYTKDVNNRYIADPKNSKTTIFTDIVLESFDDLSYSVEILDLSKVIDPKMITMNEERNCLNWSKRRCLKELAAYFHCSVDDLLVDCMCVYDDYGCSCTGGPK